MPTKRRKNILSLETKVKILKKLENGVQASRLAYEYNVSQSAISYIKANKQAFMKAVPSKKKTLHQAEYPKMEKLLYEWYSKKCLKKCTMSGSIIREKAKKIFQRMYPKKDKSEFLASDGWFSKFKKRYGIRKIKIPEEVMCSAVESITPFLHNLREKIAEMGLVNQQIYNAAETALFYRCLPKKTYGKNKPGQKVYKEHITILFGANADGSHKLQPLVIGKAHKPRCFKGFNNPLPYANSENACMTSHIFHDWFHKSFIAEVARFSLANNLPQKALLLIDNCSAHSPIEQLQSEDGNIVAVFLPSKVMAVAQPMHQNTIKIVKLIYRNQLLAQLIADGGDLQIALKRHSICDAILLLKAAWDKVCESVIGNSWSTLLYWDSFTEDDDLPLARLIRENPYTKVLLQNQYLLSQIVVNDNDAITIDAIEEWNNDTIDNEYLTVESDDLEEVTSSVAYNIAIESVNNLISWCKSTGSVKRFSNQLLAVRHGIVTANLYIPKEHSDIQD